MGSGVVRLPLHRRDRQRCSFRRTHPAGRNWREPSADKARFDRQSLATCRPRHAGRCRATAIQRNTVSSAWHAPVRMSQLSFPTPFQVRSATVQHRRHGGVNGGGKGRGQGLQSPEAMRAQRAPLRLAFSPSRLWHVVYAGFSGSQLKNILA